MSAVMSDVHRPSPRPLCRGGVLGGQEAVTLPQGYGPGGPAQWIMRTSVVVSLVAIALFLDTVRSSQNSSFSGQSK